MDIEIERYNSPKVDIYRTNGELYGVLNNEHEFNRFRINMLKNDAVDQYYFMWGDVKITIDDDGSMSSFPRGLYDQVNRDLAEIIKLRKK